ncbi:MAG: Trm112 family protein [Ignisphaera sp.]
MRYATIDIIICPNCRFYPLEVISFETQTINKKAIEISIPFCRTYCGLNKVFLTDVESKTIVDCKLCLTIDIIWGLILCPHCCKWYPIISGLPLLYPNYLKNNKRIKALYNLFEKRFSDALTKFLHRCK